MKTVTLEAGKMVDDAAAPDTEEVVFKMKADEDETGAVGTLKNSDTLLIRGSVLVVESPVKELAETRGG